MFGRREIGELHQEKAPERQNWYFCCGEAHTVQGRAVCLTLGAWTVSATAARSASSAAPWYK